MNSRRRLLKKIIPTVGISFFAGCLSSIQKSNDDKPNINNTSNQDNETDNQENQGKSNVGGRGDIVLTLRNKSDSDERYSIKLTYKEEELEIVDASLFISSKEYIDLNNIINDRYGDYNVSVSVSVISEEYNWNTSADRLVVTYDGKITFSEESN